MRTTPTATGPSERSLAVGQPLDSNGSDRTGRSERKKRGRSVSSPDDGGGP